MPGQRQRYLRVVDLRRVDRDVLTESTLSFLLLGDARRENPSEVPVAVLVLPEVDDRAVCLEVAEQNPAIEQVAWIVLDADRARREEHRVLVVADLDRVDRHAVEESAAHVADVDLALHATLEHGADHAAHALLAEAGV